MNLAISFIDVAIVVGYVGAVVALGLWIGRRQNDLSGYLLGNRDLPWWAVLGSIVATETSTATFLSVPGIAFATGGDLRFLQLAMGFVIGRMVISVVLLPHFFRGNLFSAYEVLDKRFGGAAKQAASLLFLVARNLGDGLRLFLTGIVLEKVAGLDLWLCIVLIGICTIIYTFVGGMKAVVWNDCIQFVIYTVGGVAALLLIVHYLPGGWGQLFEYGRGLNKFQVFDLSLAWDEPFTIWAGIIGGGVLTLGTHGTDQMMVQRYLCTRDVRAAGRALIASGFVVLVQFTLFLLLGVALACFYTYGRVAPTFERNDEVFATFIVREMPVGMVGLTLAAAFSAAMSTLSSSLNSSAAATVNDFYRPARGNRGSSKHLVRVSQWLTVVFGVVQVIIGIGASYVSRSVVSDALAIAGFTAGLLLGVFLLGVLTRRVGQSGALTGMIAGAVVLLGVKFLVPLVTDRPIAWPWYAPIGASTTFLVGYGVSLLIPNGGIREGETGEASACQLDKSHDLGGD